MMPIHKHDAIDIQLTINNNVTLISGPLRIHKRRTRRLEIYSELLSPYFRG